MDILNRFTEPALAEGALCRCIRRDGSAEESVQPILTEHSLTVQIENGPAADFVCMPRHLPELIAGHLLTEGYIGSPGDILDMVIHSSGHRADVRLKDGAAAPRRVLAALSPTDWDLQRVFALADAFAGEMPLHNLTFAAHSCFLACRGEIVFACEDIGRHNALDKAVGFAMIHELKPTDCMLYSSGRMPVDMVSKAIRAGFPVLISKGSPTAGAVALAKQYGLTLICGARRDVFRVFSDGAQRCDG